MSVLAEAGVCSHCGNVIKAIMLPSGKKVPLACVCQRKKRQQQEQIRKAQETAAAARRAEREFLEQAGERYRDKTFENFRRDKEKKDENHWRLMRGMATRFEDFLQTGKGALILGSYGCGKTHLEVALGRELIKQGYSVKMYGASSLYDRYMSAFSWRLDYSPEDVIKEACDCDLLILDDVGVNTLATDKDNFAKFAYSLINHRYNQKKPVLMSSNLSAKDLKDALSLRVYDRILAMAFLVVNKCPSRRSVEGRQTGE